ncbi:hypothetical protein BDBG_04930 [Blastomyces gilchristii SLH14081]|uniref:Uncharacterized protein n=1 Tax=Blastomyces gilchristii (strain SLH14081) TaxID=559298 RepID=A0A179UNS9_BLAGS|nr:uncharacterized protein BDBG_04930 [Blastomyces gilchristii SLH14081]OAT08691.1 hypothetical protein BDBG_04930 [Blastomyces gilchristii SLH14081]
MFDSLFHILNTWKARAWDKKPSASPAASQEYEPIPEDYPIFPPPPPEEIIKDLQRYSSIVALRKYAAPRGIFQDSSLYTLYRLYEYFVLDERYIPDPKDDDPSRYEFLAATTYLIVRAFNARVKLGLSRSGRALMSVEEAEEARNKPESERQYEKAPLWAENVPALKEILVIPPLDGTCFIRRNR